MGDLAWYRAMRLPSWRSLVVLAAIVGSCTFTLLTFASPASLSLSHGAAAAAAGSSTKTPPPPTTRYPEPSPSGAQYTAVIIETSLDPVIIPIILHFAAVLAPWWTITLFTVEENWGAAQLSSAPLARTIAEGRLAVRFLPPGTVLSNSGAVSTFLTQEWFWQQLQWAERVLLFQADSILCSCSNATVDDFLEYDLIGAPIDKKFGVGYNGGLSLRNPALSLRIIREADFGESPAMFEDQWFYSEAAKRVDREGVRLPGVEVARTFAVETIYYETPLGYHQPARWQAKRMDEIEAWCPEVKMLIGRRAT